MSLMLSGLDGSNPLAFLAALGTLRILTGALPDVQVKMSWSRHTGAYRPAVHTLQALTEDDVVARLDEQLKAMNGHIAFGLGDNLAVASEAYRCYAQTCVDAARPLQGDRIAADFAAAFACDALLNEQGTVQDTALRTMSGAGHQHFLRSMRQIISQTTAEHVRKALFAPWAYDDPVANQTLRWDPSDDSRYALQWRDPSGDPDRKRRGSMLGANRLAMEGLPLLPCAPVGKHLETTGFVGRGRRDTYWTWPIWSAPICLAVCRSVLSQAAQKGGNPIGSDWFRAVGIVAGFRCQRITVGKFRNFAPAVAVF
ncbi:MAG: hypothetical protein KBE65_16245 [Phycisphaerae bacterium]|nr:hypothetical protein [Phycisphaerae bacterium]